MTEALSAMTSINQPAFTKLANKALSRRKFLVTGTAFGSIASIFGTTAPGTINAKSKNRLLFETVPTNRLDTVTVPRGYNWHVVASWGDPLWSDGSPFDYETRGTGSSQERAIGDNNDGMSFFQDGAHSVLVVNNESCNHSIIYGNRTTKLPENADDIRKGKAAHGVSIFEIKHQDDKWQIVLDSPYNRKVTADTPIDITGPARGHDLLKTAQNPDGDVARGTFNNCGNGRTPWGTYLTCEENFNGYFSASNANYQPSMELTRYGIGNKDRGYAWANIDERFDISLHPNEPNRHGYIVEIDPLNPSSRPRKRTALGRFKHENAEVTLAADGRIVVYMGDDERGEYLYKFISDRRYANDEDTDTLLDSGSLYAAKFEDGGEGRWLELSRATTGMASQAEICIHTRLAASAVKATTMDRPEWICVDPLKEEVYCCLTNNKNRGIKPNRGGDPTPVGGPNPRTSNKYGQIVRWRPTSGDHASAYFDWNLFAVAGNPTVYKDARAGSENISADNTFNSPDGLAFDNNGLLWIQTDGNYSNEGDFAGQGNNQMLAGDPASGEIKRFLVGPKECEVTGITWSANRKTMFVGIQHPGERGDSHFPDGDNTVPRSSIVAIARDDDGLIG